MNKYTIISVLIVVLAAAVFVVARTFMKPGSGPNAGSQTKSNSAVVYMIDGEAVDQEAFMKLKSSLMISGSGADVTTTAGDFSRYVAKDSSGQQYTYMEGSENNLTKYIIRRDSNR